MYAGRLVELADVLPFFEEPLHPYTQDLLASVPNIKLDDDELRIMKGAPPDLIDPPSGCRFHPRCQYMMDKCSQQNPPIKEVRPGHWAACWLYE